MTKTTKIKWAATYAYAISVGFAGAILPAPATAAGGCDVQAYMSCNQFYPQGLFTQYSSLEEC